MMHIAKSPYKQHRCLRFTRAVSELWLCTLGLPLSLLVCQQQSVRHAQVQRFLRSLLGVLQGSKKVGNRYVGGSCVKSSGSRSGTSSVGVFLWVLCSILFTLTLGGAALWLQQAGFLTWDNIRSRFFRSRGALDESLYHELSMDTGF